MMGDPPRRSPDYHVRGPTRPVRTLTHDYVLRTILEKAPSNPSVSSTPGQAVSCLTISAESCRFVIFTKRPSLTV